MDINIVSPQLRSTPLHLAAKKFYWSTLECLVGWGADLHSEDSNGDTPLHIVVSSRSPMIPESTQLKQVRILYNYD